MRSFRSHRERIQARQAQLQPTERSEHQVMDRVRASLAELKKPLGDLVATWKALPQEARSRFQQTLMPVGYLLGRVGTADLGLLFKIFRAMTNPESNEVRPSRIRTYDRSLKRRLLYQLSYGRLNISFNKISTTRNFQFFFALSNINTIKNISDIYLLVYLKSHTTKYPTLK